LQKENRWQDFTPPADGLFRRFRGRFSHRRSQDYGTLAAFVNRLGLDSDAAILQNCLDQTYDGDRRMTEIATS